MKITASVCANKGRIRGNNEDNFFLNGVYLEKAKRDVVTRLSAQDDSACQLYAVCDGMGGEMAGEEASYAAVAAMCVLKERLINEPGKAIDELLDVYTEQVNQEILQFGEQGHMGTTLALLCVRDGQARVAHMGDSRIYRLRNGEMLQLTTDHSEGRRLLALGLIDEEKYKVHPMRNAIVRYLGMYYPDMQITAEISEPLELQNGDRFLLCSDGLSDMVSQEDIYRLLGEGSPLEAAQSLEAAALDGGGRDNITVMVVDVGSSEEGKSQGKTPMPSPRFLLTGGVIVASLAIILAVLFGLRVLGRPRTGQPPEKAPTIAPAIMP